MFRPRGNTQLSCCHFCHISKTKICFSSLFLKFFFVFSHITSSEVTPDWIILLCYAPNQVKSSSLDVLRQVREVLPDLLAILNNPQPLSQLFGVSINHHHHSNHHKTISCNFSSLLIRNTQLYA